jgi:dipeptidyl aminopeptidase/acylaminoacyl peptidase
MLLPLDLADDARWKARFRAPRVYFAFKATHRADRGLVLTNRPGVAQLHAWDIPTGDLHQLTHQPAGMTVGGISPSGDWIYYLHDRQGNEIGHFVRVPYEGGEPEDITPDLPPYSGYFLAESLDGSRIGLMAANADGFNVYTLDKGADGTLGAPSLLYNSKRYTFGPYLSYDGAYGVIATTERGQHTDLALLAFHIASPDPDQRVKVLQEDDGGLTPVAFSPVIGDTRLLVNTDVTGFVRPLLWDVASGDRVDIPLSGMDGDISALGWSPDGTRLLLRQLVSAVYQLYVYDIEQAMLTRLAHPSGTYYSAYFATDDTIYALVQNSLMPASVVALDAATGQQTGVLLKSGDVPDGIPWRSVTFTGANGHPIQAWLAVPEGEGPFPTILNTHGGPTAVQTDAFMPSAQAWLDHGFAWFSINYHGSTTFGRQFEHSILERLGQLEAEDMAAAYQYLVDHGIAMPDSVLLTGGSYGGYLTLLGLGKRPDLWAGGVAEVAIADWNLMYEDQAETLRGYQRSLFGGTPAEKPDAHRTSSPITYVQNFRAPVLVIQGENDSRCPSRQMRAFESQMQAAGKQIQIHWFDAGHGSLSIDESIKHQELALRFAYQVLG